MLRLIAILCLGLGLVAGLKLDRALQRTRCLDAGGQVDARGLCRGLAP
jgi:hypothetical protein